MTPTLLDHAWISVEHAECMSIAPIPSTIEGAPIARGSIGRTDRDKPLTSQNGVGNFSATINPLFLQCWFAVFTMNLVFRFVNACACK